MPTRTRPSISSSGDEAATQADEQPAPANVNIWATSVVRFLQITQWANSQSINQSMWICTAPPTNRPSGRRHL